LYDIQKIKFDVFQANWLNDKRSILDHTQLHILSCLVVLKVLFNPKNSLDLLNK
ncbi:4591_t:CDS:1, partial [Cetraspora pellucida]